MNRSKRIVATCHCILNANAKVPPLATVGGVFAEAVSDYIAAGCGLFQLPCPEAAYLGMKRWGMTREQYDHPHFRAFCREILRYPLVQLQAFAQAGYELVGIIGMDGSPNCGVTITCEGYSGGELCSPENLGDQIKALRFVAGRGVFMTELLAMLQQAGLQPKLLAVREVQPTEQRKGEEKS
jgi:predicted secreted protein